MGIIYIGDRQAGKTHLALELANPNHRAVSVRTPSYEALKKLYYDSDSDSTKPTQAERSTYNRSLEIAVDLPIGKKSLNVDWLDTPGEIWQSNWQKDNPQQWAAFLEKARQSEGILLVLSPWREKLKSSAKADDYKTQQQWINRFDHWVQFFQQDCPNVKRVAICLNKVDLCEGRNLDEEAARLEFEPYQSKLTWIQRHQYVCCQYLAPIHPQLEAMNKALKQASICCFITSIHNRTLLELPWIYFASYLSV